MKSYLVKGEINWANEIDFNVDKFACTQEVFDLNGMLVKTR